VLDSYRSSKKQVVASARRGIKIIRGTQVEVKKF